METVITEIVVGIIGAVVKTVQESQLTQEEQARVLESLSARLKVTAARVAAVTFKDV